MQYRDGPSQRLRTGRVPRRGPGRAWAAACLCVCLLLGAAAGRAEPARAEAPLTIYYFPRPPFYVTDADGRATGRLVDLTRAIMARAGIRCRFVAVPSKRALLLLRQGAAGCGVGWMRTPEREAFVVFSRPIHRDAPLVALMRPERAAQLPPGTSLAGLLSSGLVLGVIDGFSYGHQVDRMIARANPARQVVTGEVVRLMRMTIARRCDWLLADRREAQWQLGHDPDLARGLRMVDLADAPPGNLRHLMCSPDLAGEMMERIDRAIVQTLGDHPAAALEPEGLPPAGREAP